MDQDQNSSKKTKQKASELLDRRLRIFFDVLSGTSFKAAGQHVGVSASRASQLFYNTRTRCIQYVRRGNKNWKFCDGFCDNIFHKNSLNEIRRNKDMWFLLASNYRHAEIERLAANDTNSVDWIRLIGGGFAHMTAPFAVHPSDRDRANKYLQQARDHGLTVADAVEHAREYLHTAHGWPTNKEEQLQRVEEFFTGKVPRG